MKKTLYYCDICGVDIKPEEGIFSTADGKDICTECMEMLVNEYFAKESILTDQIKMVPVDKIVSRGTEAKQEAPKVPYDRGKAQALRNAGWPIKKIAEEMHRSESFICTHTQRSRHRSRRRRTWSSSTMTWRGWGSPMRKRSRRPCMDDRKRRDGLIILTVIVVVIFWLGFMAGRLA